MFKCRNLSPGLSIRSLFAAGLAAVLALSFTAPVRAEEETKASDSPSTISVAAQGTVKVKADVALIALSVRENGPTAKQAAELNAAKMQKVIQALNEQGLKPGDYNTSGYNISARYNWQAQPPKVVSYEVQNSLNIRITNLDKVGGILSAALDAGANDVQSVSYDLQDKSKVYQEALKQAVQSAKDKAGVLADAAGAKLDPKPITVSESSSWQYHADNFRAMNMNAMPETKADESLSDVPLSAYDITVTAYVKAVYGLTPEPEDVNRSIRVQAEGKVILKPDTASIRLTVREMGQTAKEATELCNQKMDAVFKALESMGLTKDNYHTSDFYLSAQYNWDSNPPQRTGFQAQNTISVTTDQVDKLGDILSAALDAGANEVEDIRYDVKDKTKAYHEALKEAVQSAHTKAGTIAEAAEVKIDDIPALMQEGTIEDVPYLVENSQMKMEASPAAGPAANTPFAAGVITITADVTAFYNVK